MCVNYDPHQMKKKSLLGLEGKVCETLKRRPKLCIGSVVLILTRLPEECRHQLPLRVRAQVAKIGARPLTPLTIQSRALH